MLGKFALDAPQFSRDDVSNFGDICYCCCESVPAGSRGTWNVMIMYAQGSGAR